jgi:hypothetical protein
MLGRVERQADNVVGRATLENADPVSPLGVRAMVHYPNRVRRIDQILDPPKPGEPLALDGGDRRWIVRAVRPGSRARSAEQCGFEVWVV